jgi:hypothetical protein
VKTFVHNGVHFIFVWLIIFINYLELHNEELNDLLLLTQYCAGYKIEKNEMGGACSADGVREACIGLWWGNLRERDHWGDPDVDGRIILGCTFRKWNVGYGLDWAGSG